jgi:hypothetical protein
MPEQRIPRPDGDFSAWSEQYVESVKAFWAEHGLDENDLKALDKGRDAWGAAFTKSVQAEAAYQAALESKRAARAEFESAIRPVSAFIQTFFKTTNADRATIGITVRDDSATRTPPPATAPQVSIKLEGRLKHTLRICDSATPLKLAKPRGVRGCEVWMRLEEANGQMPNGQTAKAESAHAGTGAGPSSPSPLPTVHSPLPSSLNDPSTFTYVGLATRAHHDTEFPLADRGKSAVYMLRWINTRGTPGPWSEVASATVAA